MAKQAERERNPFADYRFFEPDLSAFNVPDIPLPSRQPMREEVPARNLPAVGRKADDGSSRLNKLRVQAIIHAGPSSFDVDKKGGRVLNKTKIIQGRETLQNPHNIVAGRVWEGALALLPTGRTKQAVQIKSAKLVSRTDQVRHARVTKLHDQNCIPRPRSTKPSGKSHREFIPWCKP